MGKDQELLQAVKDQDIQALQRILMKNRTSKSKLHVIGSGKRLNVNFQDEDGMACLHQAALVGNVEIMRLLLDNGAAVDVKDRKGMRPLHYAAWQGKHEPVLILLNWGSSANEPALDGETPMHLACQHGHFDVVNMLLLHRGDPTLPNKVHKSPLDLACEFGRFRVVELLLNGSMCHLLLTVDREDMVDNSRTTALHLAAKNGHSEIIRLLLHAGVDINRTTLQGTCLHEAALYGKIEVCKLLLDCGVDVNKPNSYDQTALDIVNKFTTSRAAKELKQLLKEASYAIYARAIKDYCNIYDPNTIALKEGDFISVVEQRTDGQWRGYVLNDTHMAKTGYFPSNHVVLVDRQVVSNGLAELRANSPPSKGINAQVPDLLNRTHNNYPLTQLDRNNFASVGIDESFPPPPSPLVPPRSPSRDSDRDSGISPQQHHPPFPFPGYQYGGRQPSPNSPDQPSDWFGRHVVDGDQRSSSPCSRDSPSSSNRNSGASSGSGSSYLPSHNYVNVQITSQHRLSGQSYESGVSSRQSYHSTSSSSLGSLDRLEESGYSSTVNVHELFQAGYSDTEVLHAWLVDLHFEEYFNLFIQAGYDMPTVSRMTPEDLTAIGITKPAHRKRLKAEISKLHIHDGIPDYRPNEMGEWLRLLNLECYFETLAAQGYNNIDYVTDITWEDLEEIGIKKLGHQKKIMLAIERLKRIQSGGRRISSMERRGSTEMLEPPSAYPTPSWLGRESSGGMVTPPVPAPAPPSHYGQEIAITTGKPKRSPSGDSLSTAGASTPELRTFSQHREDSPGLMYQPDVVAIQVRGGSKEGSQDSPQGQIATYQSFHGPIDYVRTLDDCDDGECTPTNEKGGGSSDEMDGTATLRRPSAVVSPRISPKPKPVAKIIAKTKRSSRDVSGEFFKFSASETQGPGYSTATLGRKSSLKSEHIYDLPSDLKKPQPPQVPAGAPQSPKLSSPATITTEVPTPPGTPTYGQSPSKSKKAPPPPPKRTNSIKDHAGLQGYKGNECSSPGPQSPVPVHHQKALSECIGTLSRRFSEKSELNQKSISQESLPAPPREYTPPENDDFPPPPPPITLESSVDNPLTAAIEQLERCSQKAVSSPEPPPKPEPKPKPGSGRDNKNTKPSVDEHSTNSSESKLEVKRNESSSSIDSNNSVSSTDSNTLPFANENVGTIKQRNAAAKPSIVTVSNDEDGEGRNVDLNTGLFEDGSATMKRNPKVAPSSQDQQGQPTAQVNPLQRGTPGKKVPPPTPPKRRESVGGGEGNPAVTDQAEAVGGKNPAQTGDVLNDIGNMLQDLTDELDAMLEFELQ